MAFKITKLGRLKKLAKKGPPVAAAAYAWELLKSGKAKEAKALVAPSDGDMAFVRGLILEKEGKKEEALEAFLKVVEVNPFYLGVRRRIVELALDLDKPDVAIEHMDFLKSCFAVEDELVAKVNELIEVEVVEDEAEVQEEDEDLLILDEEDFVTVELVRSYVEQCLFEEAYQQVQKLLEIEPDNTEAQELKSKIEEYLKLLEPEEPEQ